MVLADGSQVRASADEHPDLFWALRGGGGNFGVVTSFEFRTHPIGATLMAGPTFWPIEQTPEVMRFYREFLPSAPRAVNGFFAAMTVPPVDLFPPELHMRKVARSCGASSAPRTRPTRLLAPVHDVGTPLLHGVGPVPHPALQSLFDGLYTKGLAVLLARGLRQRAVRRADRAPSRMGSEAAVHALDDAPVPDRRRRPRRRTRPTPRSATATRNGRRSSSALILTRPTPARFATGASATGTRPTLTRPAAHTSTS